MLDRCAGMLRMLVPALVLVACDWSPSSTDVGLRPIHSDLDAPECDIGWLEIAAPLEGIHYDKSLDVLVDETELWTLLTLTIGDDIGDTYLPTMESTAR